LIDLAGNLKENLPQIKNEGIRRKLEQSLQAYTDAYWDATFQAERPITFFKVYGDDIRKYGVYESTYPDKYGTFLRLGREQIIMPVWAVAKGALTEAEAAARKVDESTSGNSSGQ
jgi:hypothetical protein